MASAGSSQRPAGLSQSPAGLSQDRVPRVRFWTYASEEGYWTHWLQDGEWWYFFHHELEWRVVDTSAWREGKFYYIKEQMKWCSLANHPNIDQIRQWKVLATQILPFMNTVLQGETYRKLSQQNPN